MSSSGRKRKKVATVANNMESITMVPNFWKKVIWQKKSTMALIKVVTPGG